ncbi:hypothetical protein ACI2JA_04205 [Alkalihalobacillus sp. NPDC078783]
MEQNEKFNSRMTKNSIDLIGTVKYGEINVDEIIKSIGFPKFNHDLEFKLYRDTSGIVKHTFNFNSLILGWHVYYVDGLNGHRTNDGTREHPKQEIDLTIREIELEPSITNAIIFLLGDYIPRTRSAIGSSVSITKNYAIIAENERFMAGSIEPELSWSDEGEGVYKATRSSVAEVFDDTVRSSYELPTTYKKVNTLEACRDERGTWFQLGSALYVHRLNNSVPRNGETYVTVNAHTLHPVLKEDSLLMIRNMTILSGADRTPAFFSSDEGTKGHVIVDNFNVLSSKGSGANGIGTDNLKSFWIFNSLVKDVQRDGFNYHATRNGDSFVFEYNVLAENCGVNDSTDINNATTAHEGIHILRVRSFGIRTKGPVLADVHGCYSICIDCNMNDCLIENDSAYNKAAFFFEDNSQSHGHAILINCSGGDRFTKGISCGTSFKAEGKIAVLNFVGSNIPGDINFLTM